MNTPIRIFLALSLLALSSAAAWAADGPPTPPNDGGKPPGPPPEAVAACKGRAEGDAASFSGPRGETFSGTCQRTDAGLAVRPAKGQQPPSPPPQR